ncbi:MAG: hypothetical protein K9M36_00030 [Candidatus Pacebacteria bacterium]|nr:hypothetical protein [Candidatus Paceibacterota bacterium]
MNGYQPHFLNIEYLFDQILRFFESIFSLSFGSQIGTIFIIMLVIGGIMGIIGLISLIYVSVKLSELKEEHEEKIRRYIFNAHTKEKAGRPSDNPRWRQVMIYMQSARAEDWKLAIIEADAMLEDLTTDLGFHGVSLGEKLKNVDPGDFPLLQQAWDAHKVRNAIAHQGMTYELSHALAYQTIKIYETIFLSYRII